MIKLQDGYVLDDIQPYSVILHQVNCNGKLGSGVTLRLQKKYPEMYVDYHNYCALFQPNAWDSKSHEDEIQGTWHRWKTDNDIIICSAFCQKKIAQGKCATDLDALDKVLRKLERQTRNVNRQLKTDWTIHMQHKFGYGLSDEDWDIVMELIEQYFKNSPVKFIIHEL